MTVPSTQRTSLEEAIGHVEVEREVWVRLAAVRKDDGTWHARLLELTSGAAPPGWTQMEWAYPSAVLAAVHETGDTVSRWLLDAKTTVNGREIRLPQATDTLFWERAQSHSSGRYGYEMLEWPSAGASLALADTFQAEPMGHLVSHEDAPSFIDLYTAAARFFCFRHQPTGGSLPHDLVYRHQDMRGRLRGIRVTEDEVVVEVDGNGFGGMVAELAGDAPGSTRRLTGGSGMTVESVRFPIENGLPPGSWLLLRLGDEWIDRRFLTAPWTRNPEPGVEIVVEPRTKLEAFLAEREGPQVEFKRQVPTDDDSKTKVMKTVCAFANGQGGSILFGIDDEHSVVGVAASGVDRVKDQLTQTVGSWVEPRPQLSFEILPLDDGDRVVLEMRVAPGTELHGCARPGEVPMAYIRHYATTVRARPGEVEGIVRARIPSGGSPRAWGIW